MKRRLITETLFAISSFGLGKWIAGDNLQTELYGMSIGFGMAVLLDIALYSYDNRKFVLLFIRCKFSHKELRLSISYLFNIEVRGKYLLIKSNRLDDTFQPVGGVYKYFNPEGKKQLESLGIITDNFVVNDEVSEHDLRVKMRSRSKMPEFIEWFFKAKNREVDPWREFYEELIEPGLLPPEKFRYINYELVGNHFEKIHYDKFFKIDTFKYADIYKPKFVNGEQEKELLALFFKKSSDYIWATEDEIKQEISNDGKRIAEHTKKIFT